MRKLILINLFFFFSIFTFLPSSKTLGNSYELEWFNHARNLFLKIDLKTTQVLQENPTTQRFDVIGKISTQHPEIISIDHNKHTIKEFSIKNKTIISIIGTSLVYEFLQSKDEFQLKRLDNSSFRGFNFWAHQFARKDTIYSIGGYGFWNYNNTLIYFDEKNKGWESVKFKNEGPKEVNYEVSGYDTIKDGIWTLDLINPDKSFDGKTDYHLYFFDFKTKKWENKGKLNKSIFDQYNCRIESGFWINNHFVFNKRESCLIINPRENSVFISDLKNRQIGNGKEMIEHKDSIYFYSPNEINTLEKFLRLKIAKKQFFDQSIKLEETFTDQTFYKQKDNWMYFFIALLTIGLILKLIQQIRKRNSIFDDKEIIFLKRLLEKEEGFTTDELNEFLDIDKKNIDIQKNQRNHFIKHINSKFRIKYNGENLIERKSSENDKRFVNYVVNPKHLSAIKTMI